MQVKNNSKVPIEIGHTIIAPGQVASIEDTLLYQPRVQSLRASGDLIFPFTGETVASVQPAPVEPQRRVLEIVTVVPPPTDNVDITMTEEEKPRSKRK
jgi:hypothetical protein